MSEDIKNNPYFMFGNDTNERSDELPYEDDFLSTDTDSEFDFDDLASDLLDKAENMARVMPECAEVLGNCIIYNLEEENFARAKYYYEHLKRLDTSLYGVKAYIALIKYEMTDPIKNEASLRRYMSEFKEKFAKNEEPYVREALLEQCLGNDDKAHEVLTEAIKNAVNPVNAYTMLAKIELDQKEYEDCRKTVINALSSTAKEESMLAALMSLYYVMSYESELEDRMASEERINPQDFDKVIKDYEELLKSFGRNIHEEQIKERIGLLRFWRYRYENQKED